MSSPLRPHLSPQEVARRQRWVAVGVTVLAILLVGTWVATLPGRISNVTGSNATWRLLLGEIPQTNYIDTDKLINNEVRQQEEEAFKNVLNAIISNSTTSTATSSTSTPAAAATSTKQ